VFTLKNTSFNKCEIVNGDGGGIWVKLKNNGSISLSNSSFEGCICGRYGGAIYIWNSDGVNPFFVIQVLLFLL
jgi:hypothetical protein